MANFVEKELVQKIFPKRPEDSNKGTFGKIINIAGSKNYTGAAYLSSLSALKIGAGYVSLACPKSITPIIASILPEVTFIPLDETSIGSISKNNLINDINSFNVISIGCGITTHEETKNFAYNIIKEHCEKTKLIIDADGINTLADYKNKISLKGAVITPHPKELSRLLDVHLDEIIKDREKFAQIASQTYECITVLKGHNSIITDGEHIFINKTGSSALAKAGTGDVLTGMIAGLMAQKLKPFDAAILGTYLHGLSGNLAEKDLTKYSVLATNVIEYLPFAIKEIMVEE